MQESKLYYDTERGAYYYYDPETRKYSIHSRVKLPTIQDREPVTKSSEPVTKSSEPVTKSSEPVINLCSSEEEFAGVLSIGNNKTQLFLIIMRMN